MQSYMGMVMVLSFIVNVLLLFAAGYISGDPPGIGRASLAAATDALYCGGCLVPGFSFLSSVPWRMIFLCLVCLVAFGISVGTLGKGAVFSLLHLALYGITVTLESGKLWTVLLGVALILLICRFAFRGSSGGGGTVPVELSYRDKRLQFTALRDTGNTLKDPVTGSPVLVVGAEIAGQLLGLTRQQLKEPAQTLVRLRVPGLRLVPFRTVGQSGGLMLALRLQDVRIGKWKGSSLVAFAPEGLSRESGFQGLSGGWA